MMQLPKDLKVNCDQCGEKQVPAIAWVYVSEAINSAGPLIIAVCHEHNQEWIELEAEMKRIRKDVSRMGIKPILKTKCFFILDIGNEVYLLDHDPSEDLRYPEDADHLYREIVEGVFYPVENSKYIDGKKIVGYFVDEENQEFVYFYNDEFFSDAEWRKEETK